MYSMDLAMKQTILAIVNPAHLGSRSCDLVYSKLAFLLTDP